jgi:hypothetical protein
MNKEEQFKDFHEEASLDLLEKYYDEFIESIRGSYAYFGDYKDKLNLILLVRKTVESEEARDVKFSIIRKKLKLALKFHETDIYDMKEEVEK